MKKIIIALLIMLGNLSFAWERNSYTVEIKMTSSEIKNFFGENTVCTLFGAGVLTITSVGESENPYILAKTRDFVTLLELYSEALITLSKELNIKEDEKMDVFFRKAFDKYNCKIPDKKTLKQFGVKSFEELMNSIRDIKSEKVQKNDCEKYRSFKNSTDYEIERYFELVYTLKYGNSSLGDIEKLKEITNAKLCKLNNFH